MTIVRKSNLNSQKYEEIELKMTNFGEEFF